MALYGCKNKSSKAVRPDISRASQPDTEDLDDTELDTGLSFTVVPDRLRVYRSTTVTMRLTGTPPGTRADRVEWSFSDKSPPVEGEKSTHTFEGGLRDHFVSVRVHLDNGKVLRAKKEVVLDRIGPEYKSQFENAIAPPPPITGYGGTRLVIANHITNRADVEALARVVPDLAPDVFILATNDSSNTSLRSLLASKLLSPLAKDNTLILPIPGPQEAGKEHKSQTFEFWSSHKPDAKFMEESEFPFHFALKHERLFLTSIQSQPDSIDDELERLKAVLSKAQSRDFGIVLSYFPLASFSSRTGPRLDQAYRFYEGLARYGVQMLVSAADRTTYFASYGAVKAINAGYVGGACDPLPDKTCVPPAVVVLDFQSATIRRAFAVEIGDSVVTVPISTFPERVHDYRRWNP
ncbi:MAG: hypothetical protein CMH54_03345 [Myxococcales bacterium]|nr:hypothetical protein [Myxococcales bacterium]